MEEVKTKALSPKHVADSARKQLGMLSAAFLLGMAVNLIGLPSEDTGGAKTASTVLLILHGLVGIGLAVGAVRTVRDAVQAGREYATLARAGSAAIGITLVAGLLTMATESNWWSYLMAIGFLASVIIYGNLMLHTVSKR